DVAGLLTVMVPHETVMRYVLPPVQPMASVAVRVKKKVPVWVGMPETLIDVGMGFVKPRPGGRAPEVTLNVALAAPPSVTVCAYTVPVVPLVRDAGESWICGHAAKRASPAKRLATNRNIRAFFMSPPVERGDSSRLGSRRRSGERGPRPRPPPEGEREKDVLPR